MKSSLSCKQSASCLLIASIGLIRQAVQPTLAAPEAQSQLHSKLLDRCCQVGKERAFESLAKLNCKLGAREALTAGAGSLLALSAESLLAREPNFADQCELVLESCCLARHRTKNCDSGKHFAKSGAACMDVELSKEASLATESFNDCCMSCSLGILAARTSNQSESGTLTRSSLANRCKLISPLASSLSGQLYEQTYVECCEEKLPMPLGALTEPGAPIDCSQANPCSQRCTSAGRLGDRCDCFSGYKLAPDGVNCLDIDECKLNTHTCSRQSEVCDNTRGGFRCLARQTLDNFEEKLPELADNLNAESFMPLRLCPLGSRWNAQEGLCQPIAGQVNNGGNERPHLHQHQARSASLSTYHRTRHSSHL